MVAATKLFIGYKQIKLLGHFLGGGDVRMDPDKVSAIRNLTPPTSVKELRAFLGIAGYYRRFIRNFAKKTFNLTQLLKGDSDFEWSSACNKEFTFLRHELALAPILRLPTSTGKFRLYTDFCSYAISAILH
jgi:hypothetical protein